MDLDFLLQRDAPNGEVAPGTLPAVFSRLIAEVEARGLTEIGICKSRSLMSVWSNSDLVQTALLVRTLR